MHDNICHIIRNSATSKLFGGKKTSGLNLARPPVFLADIGCKDKNVFSLFQTRTLFGNFLVQEFWQEFPFGRLKVGNFLGRPKEAAFLLEEFSWRIESLPKFYKVSNFFVIKI